MCAYICRYAYLYTYIHTFYTHIHIYAHTLTYIHVCICTYLIHIYIYVWICTHILHTYHYKYSTHARTPGTQRGINFIKRFPSTNPSRREWKIRRRAAFSGGASSDQPAWIRPPGSASAPIIYFNEIFILLRASERTFQWRFLSSCIDFYHYLWLSLRCNPLVEQ